MKPTAFEKSWLIKQEAQKMGFSQVGIAKARRLEKDEQKLENFLSRGYQGKMQYLENHFDKRVDPRLLVPGAKSVISLLFNYYTDKKQVDPEAPKIATYAYGEDYHFVLKRKLAELFDFIKAQFGQVEGRVFVDSAPVLDRAWARESGLGWIGKNGMLINKGQGSYFFIAELIINLELAYDSPIEDYCGTCTKCIDDCPTEAILPNKELDASKCISYLTIELKDELIPSEFQGKMENWMFGCDICQEVCPWNRFSQPHTEKAFEPKDDLLEMSLVDWQNLSEEKFKKIFKGSAVKRTKYSGLIRNISFLRK